MKHLFKTTILFAAILTLSSCGSNDGSKTKTEMTEAHDHAAVEQKNPATVSSPVLKNDKLNAIYQHYIHLTTALTSGNETEAKIAAGAIEAGAKSLDGGNAIATNAGRITNAADIEAQRLAYENISNEMISFMKKEGLSTGELYVAHCPMAFNDKGASWISNTKEIRNPYFGDKMLGCGEVKETIK